MGWKDEWEYSIDIQVSTWPQTFDKSEALLKLCRQHPRQSSLLSACACVVLATALEQAVSSKYALAVTEADEREYKLDAYADIMEKPGFLKERVEAIPAIFTHKRLQLAWRSPHGQALGQLICHNDHLLHIREGVLTLKKGDPRARWKGNTLEPDIALPSNPWDVVPMKSARQFRDAVLIYMREVIEPDEIKPGKIVKKRRR